MVVQKRGFEENGGNSKSAHFLVSFGCFEAQMNCPICKCRDCFVSKMWSDDQLMDVLLAENGKDVRYILQRVT